MERVLVTGAGGFIGHHLVTYLKERGYWVRGVDIKRPEYTAIDADEFELADLRRREEALRVMRGIDEVYALAADMGGMGFISHNHGDDPPQQPAHEPPHDRGRARRTASGATSSASSACVYPEHLQDRRGRDARSREEDAYPAEPQDALRLGEADRRAALPLLRRRVRDRARGSSASTTSTGRYGTYDGGREKVPAALCRKVALAEPGGIDRGLGRRRADAFVLLRRRLRRGHPPDHAVRLRSAAQPRHRPHGHDQRAGAASSSTSPASRGSSSTTSTGPQGVRGRNSDNTRLREVLGWEPRISLEDGLEPTYRWIEEQVAGPARAARAGAEPRSPLDALRPRRTASSSHPLVARSSGAGRAGVRWCLLRGAEDPDSPAGDVDLLVAPRGRGTSARRDRPARLRAPARLGISDRIASISATTRRRTSG